MGKLIISTQITLDGVMTWGSGVVFDNQTVGGMSSDVRLQSPRYEGAARRYDIEAPGSGSMITGFSG